MLPEQPASGKPAPAASRPNPPPGDREIASRLLAHLRNRFRQPELKYAQQPASVTGGFETSVFAFALERPPQTLAGPLILRLFRDFHTAERARLEAVAQNTVAEAGYPAPRVFMVETDKQVLGGVFTIMERMPGKTMLEEFKGLGRGRTVGELVRLLLRTPVLLRETANLLSEAQARLHELPSERLTRALEAEGLDARERTVNGRLEWTRRMVEQAQLAGLRPGLAWLLEHRPPDPARLAICHCDFQPFNLMTVNGTLAGVIDWGNTTIADPTLDVASTAASFVTIPLEIPRFLRAVANQVQRIGARRYLAACRRHRSLDPAVTRYYEVFRCVGELALIADRSVHHLQGVGAYASPSGAARLIAHVKSLTGVALRFPGL